MTDIAAVIAAYRARFKNGLCLENEPMSAHTTFRIGGPVRAMFLPASPEETAFLAGALRAAGVRTLVIGNGSDLLVSDAPLEMAVIKLGENMAGVTAEGSVVHAGAGALIARVAAFARDMGLAGLAFAGGIPASVGGAVYMNAGAYGGEIKNVLQSVTYLDEKMDLRTIAGADCAMAYRHSRFMETEDVILAASFALVPGDREAIGAEMEELARRRREKQPVELPSAGSTFKRPAGGFAAAMIDGAGLKGLAVGGAQVSPKHAGFVVNTGGATFEDVTRLMALIEERVYERYGVRLEPEVRVIR